jgi:hypothetical protein
MNPAAAADLAKIFSLNVVAPYLQHPPANTPASPKCSVSDHQLVVSHHVSKWLQAACNTAVRSAQ